MFGTTDKTFMWILAAAGALTVGTVWYFATANDDPAPAVSSGYRHAPVLTPITPAASSAAAPAGVPQTVYITQPAEHHSGTSDLVNGMLIGNMLRGSGDTRHTTEVRHVYHPAPAAAPAPHVAPAPRPTFTPVSRPVSAIRTTSSSAVRSSPSSFRSSGRR